MDGISWGNRLIFLIWWIFSLCLETLRQCNKCNSMVVIKLGYLILFLSHEIGHERLLSKISWYDLLIETISERHHRNRRLYISREKEEKAMAPDSSPLSRKIPWMEKSGGLQSMGLLWVGHDWATSLSHFPFMHWRRKWQPTPVFLPGESQGQGSLVGCHLWGPTMSDMTGVT